jgi:hypothetical protein
MAPEMEQQRWRTAVATTMQLAGRITLIYRGGTIADPNRWLAVSVFPLPANDR